MCLIRAVDPSNIQYPQIILSDVDLVSSAAAVISGESGRSSDGITDGGVAAIVIVLILVVGAVLIVAAFLL